MQEIVRTSETAKSVKLRKSNGKPLTSLKIEHREDGQLWASNNGKAVAVTVLRCFPWSDPDRYYSLRDSDNNEVALISKLGDLDADSRKSIEAELVVAGFVMDIVKVIAITEDFEIRSWKVETSQGMRKFQTQLDDWPHQVPGGGLLIRDISDDLFYLEDPEALDEKSRFLIKSFVD